MRQGSVYYEKKIFLDTAQKDAERGLRLIPGGTGRGNNFTPRCKFNYTVCLQLVQIFPV